MEICSLKGCERPLNRDGVCFYHKMKTIRFGIEGISRERKGKGLGKDGESSTREYVRDMYEQRRRDGLPDPIPENAEAARFAPAVGPMKDKKYKEANNGL